MLASGKINGAVSVWSLTVVGFVLAVVTGIAQATPLWDSPALPSELIGSRDSSATGGVTASADWADGNFSISWVITQDSQTNLWTYQYTLTVTAKSPSHTIIEVTEDEIDPFQYEEGSSSVDAVKTFVPGEASNPNLPNALYGAKHDYSDDSNAAITTIVTQHAPVWGVFYTKDGRTGGKDGIAVTAWANALNFSDYKTSETLTTTDFIVRPNGPSPLTPEPATLSVLVLGGLTMMVRRRRRV